MSGSGGYYKYRCKYWLTYNCGNWVWVNNAPCANCLAEGRDSEAMMASPFRLSREVYVPQFENGLLHYSVMEIVAASDADSGWAIKDLLDQPFSTVSEPSVMTGISAMHRIGTQRMSKNGYQLHTERESWSGGSASMD